MNLALVRKYCGETGTFGELRISESGTVVAYSLERSYSDGGIWAPKVAPGEYICKRGMHVIEDNKGPFETFEITDVPGHTGILFHKGNYQKDSTGCILLGSYIYGNALVQSTQAFEKFMNLMAGVDGFRLTVS